jgi:hypothetical protein
MIITELINTGKATCLKVVVHKYVRLEGDILRA